MLIVTSWLVVLPLEALAFVTLEGDAVTVIAVSGALSFSASAAASSIEACFTALTPEITVPIEFVDRPASNSSNAALNGCVGLPVSGSNQGIGGTVMVLVIVYRDAVNLLHVIAPKPVSYTHLTLPTNREV